VSKPVHMKYGKEKHSYNYVIFVNATDSKIKQLSKRNFVRI